MASKKLPYTAHQLALANHLLVLNVMLALRRKELISITEGTDIIDQCLLTLESQRQTAGAAARSAFEGAGALLEQLRAALSHEDP